MNYLSNNNISFTSINNPIKPFVLKTKDGNLYFKEIDYNKKPTKKELKEIGSFFLDNFAYTSAHPYWKYCQKTNSQFDKNTYNEYVKELVDSYKTTFKNPDTTVLLGRNNKDELCAALYTLPLNLSNVIKNNKTLYVDSLAVNEQYRNNHVSKQLLEKVLNSSSDRFQNSFLIAYNEVVPFYLKQGYKVLDNNSLDDDFIRSIKELRKDYPQYCTLMTKKLDVLG